jgi:hypothetical protein
LVCTNKVRNIGGISPLNVLPNVASTLKKALLFVGIPGSGAGGAAGGGAGVANGLTGQGPRGAFQL